MITANRHATTLNAMLHCVKIASSRPQQNLNRSSTHLNWKTMKIKHAYKPLGLLPADLNRTSTDPQRIFNWKKIQIKQSHKLLRLLSSRLQRNLNRSSTHLNWKTMKIKHACKLLRLLPADLNRTSTDLPRICNWKNNQNQTIS